MNNSVSIFHDNEEKPDLATRAGKLTTLIEAAERLLQQKEWRTLQEEEFTGGLERAERLLTAEAKRSELNTAEIYRLQGEIAALKRYDVAHLRDKYRLELDAIKKLTLPTERGTAP